MIHVKSLLFRIVSDTVCTMLENIADQAKLFTVFLHEELKNWIHECGYTTRELEEITGINKDKISRARTCCPHGDFRGGFFTSPDIFKKLE